MAGDPLSGTTLSGDTLSGELVLVRLGGSRYALPMDAVAEVGRPPGLTRVPGLPGWVAGLANWRGRVLAVVDLRPLLAAPDQPLDRRGRLVVLRHGGRSAGLLAEAVDGTCTPPADAVEPVLAHLPDAGAALLAGHLTDAGGPVGLLDLGAVFGLTDTLPRPRRVGGTAACGRPGCGGCGRAAGAASAGGPARRRQQQHP